MTARLARKGLFHKYAWCTDDRKFFQAIDDTGGWPVGYQFVGFEHSEERDAGFTNSPHNDGWWTVLAHADDYYTWKLSPQGLQRIADAVHSAIRVPAVNAAKLSIRTSRGHFTAAKEPT